MLDNEFDQFFRDRLLDHPSKIRLSLWKQVHTHLLRHKAFHFWKWYFVGPSAVAVCVAGHFVLKAIQSPSPAKHTAPVAAVAPYNTRPGADSSATQAQAQAQATTALDSPAATTPNTAAANTPAAKADIPSGAATSDPLHRSAALTHNVRRNAPPANTPAANLRSATTTNALAGAKGSSANTRHRHHAGIHGQEAADEMTADATTANAKAADAKATNVARTPTGIAGVHNTRHRPGTTGARKTEPLNTSTRNIRPGNLQPDATQPGVTRTRSATQPAPLKLITLKTPAVVMAKTPNPKSPHQLTLPAPRPRRHIPINLDLFGAPEYFTWNTIGLSYSTGARVTVIFKNHWTITTGLQFEKVNVNHVKEIDSLSGLLPGKFNNFHIPLLLGYTTGNDRFSLSVNAGVLFSLYTQANGSLSQADNWPSHEGISSYLGVNFSSHITNKVSLFAEPYLKCWYIPGDQRLPPQLWSTGVIVGLRYNF